MPAFTTVINFDQLLLRVLSFSVFKMQSFSVRQRLHCLAPAVYAFARLDIRVYLMTTFFKGLFSALF